jgi:hypothetical protein
MLRSILLMPALMTTSEIFHLIEGRVASLLIALLVIGLASGCASSRPYTLGLIKTVDPDDQPIPMPEERVESMYWDRIDLSLFHQLEKPLNVNWTGRKIGNAIGVVGAKQADNVNVLDEPPRSSWWTPRHFYDEMTPGELALGPNDRTTTGGAAGPDTSGVWTVTQGKFEGAGRGFQIEDPRGDRYLIKLDGPNWPELTSSAEVISTKIFYAAGYYVPQNTVTFFDPNQLVIGDDAEVRVGGDRRPMRRSDIDEMLAPYPRQRGGRIRAMASKFVDGRPLGPFDFQGRVSDDPNDRVRHEHRRELRGLRVIGSWLNDADRRAANTLLVYTDEQYIKHYLIDMGSTLGANASGIHRPIHGQAYMIDQRLIPQAWLSFGAFEFPWLDYDPTPKYPSVGYFRADVFRPGEWVPTYPNPAFEKMTLRDAFWGAKIVMSFTDEDLEAIVKTALMSSSAAEAHLLDILKQRRDMIGRYWFARINPLDRFDVRQPEREVASVASEGAAPQRYVLAFDDLAVAGQLESAQATTYLYSMHHGGRSWGERTTHDPALPLTLDGGLPIEQYLDQEQAEGHDRVIRVDIETQRTGKARSEPVRVYMHFPLSDRAPRVVGVERVE